MYRYCAYGIINSQPFKGVDADDDQHPSDSAQKDCASGTDPVARASNRNQPSQKSVGGVTGIPRFHFEVAIQYRGETSGACGEGCVCGNSTDADEIHRRERAAGIEAIPAKPQNETATDGDGQIVGEHGLAAVALKFAT